MDLVANVIASKVEVEYVLESERKRALLAQCGVAEEDLSKNGQVYLHVLSEVAELLEIKDAKTSSFLLAMSDLEDALSESEVHARTLRTVAAASHARSQELTTQLDELEVVKHQLEAAVDEREKNENTTTMEQRTEEYKERQRVAEAELAALQSKLAAVGFDVTVDDKTKHHAISALEQECDAIDTQNRAMREQLRMYHALPLNKDVAAAQLMDAKAELQRLEDQFSAQIREML